MIQLSTWQKPVRGTPLNRSHPLARGLYTCFPFNEFSGTQVRSQGGKIITGTCVNGPEWTAGSLVFNYDAGTPANGSYVDLGDQWEPGSELTIFYRGKTAVNVGSNPPRMFSRHYTSGNYGFAYSIETDGKFRFSRSTTGANWANVEGTTAYTADTWHTAAVTYGDGYCRHYYNGLPNGSGALAGNINTESNQTTYIGADGYTIANATHRRWDGPMEAIYIFDRILSPREIASLHSEPYCMFQQPRIALAEAVAVGGVAPTGVFYGPFVGPLGGPV